MVITLDAEENINLKLDIVITWHFVLGEKEESTTWKPFLTNPSNISLVRKTIVISILQGGKLKYRNTNSLESGLKTDFESENRTFLRYRNRDPLESPSGTQGPVSSRKNLGSPPSTQGPGTQIYTQLLRFIYTQTAWPPSNFLCLRQSSQPVSPLANSRGTIHNEYKEIKLCELYKAQHCSKLCIWDAFCFPRSDLSPPSLPTLKSQSYKRVKSRIYTPCWRTEPCTSGI